MNFYISYQISYAYTKNKDFVYVNTMICPIIKWTLSKVTSVVFKFFSIVVGKTHLLKTAATHYYARLGLPNKICEIKYLVIQKECFDTVSVLYK